MEIIQLQYFLAAAAVENVNQAAENIGISPGSISKAIAKLEQELQVKLFKRVGRNIRLSSEGKVLQKKANEIVGLINETKINLSGQVETLNITLCGEELLLAKYAVEYIDKLNSLYSNINFKVIQCSSKEAGKLIESGQADLAFTSIPPSQKLKTKLLEKITFKTYVGKKHPLFKYIKKNKQIPIDEVLKHDFVIPTINILGQLKQGQSPDGWREDKFPRKLKYKTSSLKLLSCLVKEGKALAYIPDYFLTNESLGILNITGCPYISEQKIYLLCRNPKEFGWLNQIWD